jgi:hypothetical protein
MTVQGLYALQNGFMGAPRSLLFYGDYSEERVQIPVSCYLIRTSDGLILFDTGLSPACSATTPWPASPMRTCSCTGSPRWA